MLIIGIILHFLPAIIAHNRKHINKFPITVLDWLLLLFGWLAALIPLGVLAYFVAWFGILIWACTANTEANLAAKEEREVRRLARLVKEMKAETAQ